MKHAVKEATGKASYKGGILTITTFVQRGKKVVEHVTHYSVQDARPDPRVADPAFSLTKAEIELVPRLEADGSYAEDMIFTRSEEVYHVHVDEWGSHCSCPHAIFRGQNSKIECKHCLGLQAVGILPKGRA